LVRNAGLIHSSLYKNLAFAFVQFWFALICGATAQVRSCSMSYLMQTAYDDWLVTMFNITITFLPPFGIGFTEKDISEAIIDQVSRFNFFRT
jgi:magnesium-transporting ATPase (P-type)